MSTDRQSQFEQHREYIEGEGLDQLIDFSENIDYQAGVFDLVSGNLKIAIPPEPNDLVRLHQLIRERKSFTVLEFGLGYSTVIIADALQKNQNDWNRLTDKPEVRNRYMFQVFSVDTSREWIGATKERLPESLADRVHLRYSEVEIGTFDGRLCHYYKNLPDIVPDFIYLDGPSPKAVGGALNGMTFACDERTVMSGDLLLMEPILLPGTFILIDGRTNNARFLERHFSRGFKAEWDPEGDVTTFELAEERLGEHNILGSDYF